MPVTPKISPFLWFDTQAEEAARFYVSIFPGSEILGLSHYGDWDAGRKGSVLTVTFRLGKQEVVALNGGPQFKFTEAISLAVECETQEEVDRYWKALTAGGGEEGPCGWLKDRWGLSWQVNPRRLGELIGDPDPKRAKAAMDAMLKQKKIVIAEIEAAADAATEEA